MVAGRAAKNYGEAKNSWLTGTASWMFVASTQAILGIRPDYEGLRIAPSLPESIEGYEAERLFRGVRYSITVRKGKQNRITVDGQEIEGNLIHFKSGIKECRVFVEIGKEKEA